MSPTPANSLRILLADDDKELLDIFDALLLGEGYQTVTCSDGKAAQEKLSAEKFDLFIADIQMPGLTGLELLAWIRQQKIQVKTILMTGLTSLEMTKAALDYGCEAFLAKPVQREEMVHTIQFALSDSTDPNQMVENYGRIPIEDFIAGKNVPYSIYVQLKSGRFVKVAHTGEDLDLERIYNLKTKGVQELWLDKDAFNLYQQTSQKLATTISTRLQMPASKRASIVSHALEVAAQQLTLSGVGQEVLVSSQNVVSAAIQLALENDGAVAFLDHLNKKSMTRFTHLSTCSMLAVLITQAMGWTSKKNIFALALGCLLHDIALMELPENLENMKEEDIPADLKPRYREHPNRGVQMLMSFTYLPREVFLIVQQHHEGGKEGFPRGIPTNDVFPMAKVARTIDEFDTRLLQLPLEKRSPTRAIKIISDLSNQAAIGTFDFTTSCALEALFGQSDMNACKKRFQVLLTERKRLKPF